MTSVGLLKKNIYNRCLLYKGLRIPPFKVGLYDHQGVLHQVELIRQVCSGSCNIGVGTLEVFLRKVRSDIAKDGMMGDNALRSFSNALGRVLRLEAMKQRMVKERRISYQSTLVALT